MHDQVWQFKKFDATFRAKIEDDDDCIGGLDYMGEYAAKLEGQDFYVDRRKGVLFGENTVERREIKHLAEDGSGAILKPITGVCETLLSSPVIKVYPIERKVKVEFRMAHHVEFSVAGQDVSLDEETGLLRFTAAFFSSLTQEQRDALLYHRCHYNKDEGTITSSWNETSQETLDFNNSPEAQQWFDDWNWLLEHSEEIIDWNYEAGWVDAEYRVVLANNLSENHDQRSCEFWIPGENHLPHEPKNWGHVPPAEIDKCFADAELKFKKHGIKPDLQLGTKEFWLDVLYVCEDFERMEDYGTSWSMTGVVVELVVDDYVVDHTSCWGIESDSDASYFDEMADTLAHDLALRACDLAKSSRKRATSLTKIARAYRAYKRAQKAKEKKHGTAKQKAH